MWCWQDQDSNVANTNEAGSRQRSIKSMCYKSCELLPTMIAAAAFRAQPDSKVRYIALAGDSARLQSYKVSTQYMSVCSPTTQTTRWDLHFKHEVSAQNNVPLFPFLVHVQTQSIMQYCQQCSLCHIRSEISASFLSSDWLIVINSGASLVDVTPTSPMSHLSPASLQLLLLTFLWRSHLWAGTRIFWSLSVSRSADVWKCLNWLNSLLIVFRQ